MSIDKTKVGIYKPNYVPNTEERAGASSAFPYKPKAKSEAENTEKDVNSDEKT